MAVFLTEKEKKKYKIYKKGSLPESNNILSHRRRPAAVRRHRHVSGWKDHLH